MTDLLAIIQNGNGNIKLEVTGEDLLLFSNQLISRAKHELSTAIAEAKKGKVPHQRGSEKNVRCL